MMCTLGATVWLMCCTCSRLCEQSCGALRLIRVTISVSTLGGRYHGLLRTCTFAFMYALHFKPLVCVHMVRFRAYAT